MPVQDIPAGRMPHLGLPAISLKIRSARPGGKPHSDDTDGLEPSPRPDAPQPNGLTGGAAAVLGEGA